MVIANEHLQERERVRHLGARTAWLSRSLCVEEGVCIYHDESFLAGIPADEVRSLYVQAAVRAGAIRPGDALTRAHYDFAVEIVTLCARLVDRYPNPECPKDTIGDVIRGQLFEP